MLDKFLPPTDSLYKFLAISGLMLIGFSFIPSYFIFKLGEQQIESRKNLRVLGMEIKQLNDDAQNIKNDAEKVPQTPPSIKGEAIDLITKRDSQYSEKSKAVSIKLEEVKANDELLTFYIATISDYTSLSENIFQFGVLFVVVGFGLWYWKIQRPNDLILMNQSKNKEPAKLERVKRVRPI